MKSYVRVNWFGYLVSFLLIVVPSGTSAQTSQSLSINGGGILNYTVTETSGTIECGAYPSTYPVSYTHYVYNSFSYTETGITTSFAGGTDYTFVSGSAIGCTPQPPVSGPNPLPLLLPNGATITFSINTGRSANTSATLNSLIDPKYKVISILYAAPGNFSSDAFTNAATNGTVTSIGSNFSVGTSVSYSIGFKGFFSAGQSFGVSTATGMSNAFTEMLTDATSIGNASNSSAPNTIGHSQDLFVLWLNPEVALSATATSTGAYSLQTQYQNGTAEVPVFIELTAGTMQSQGGVTSIPLSLLQRQYDVTTGLNDLPGLAAICANQSQYVNNCSSGGQCGCTPSDFAGIIATDPLLNPDPSGNGNTTSNPLTVDASGVSACSNPTSTDSCRYVPVPESIGSQIQMVSLLSGPDCSGCNRPVNGYTQTDATSSTQTLSESTTETVGYTVKVGPPAFSVTNATTWSWTDSESTGMINGTSNQIQYSLSSSTVGCSEDVLIFEDTVFHTFVTQQAPGNTSCP